MRLSIEYDHGGIPCPHCGTKLHVETSYEDRLAEIDDIKTCPSCEHYIHGEAEIKIKLTKGEPKKMKITIIACCDKNGLIGIDGKIPWHLPEELRRFKTLTLGHAVIMGRGTFQSMNKKPLPGRYNIVLTKDFNYALKHRGDIFTTFSHELALEACARSGHENVFIIGGEKVYKEAFNYADRILLTRLDAEYCPGFADEVKYFPKIPDQFELDYFERYPKRGITFETWRLK